MIAFAVVVFQSRKPTSTALTLAKHTNGEPPTVQHMTTTFGS